MKKNRKVLVTGAHGFLGRYVSRCLAQAGHEVTGIGHGVWDVVDPSDYGISFWHTSDVTLDALVTYAGEPDIIVHCAGSGSVAFSMAHPHQDFMRTVSCTGAVLEYIRLHSPKTVLVYPSSAAVYGVVDALPILESSAGRPASPYGTHKLMAEQLCQSYASSFGLAVAVVRFFSIYGEGLKKQLLWDACTKASHGENSFFGTGAELRDWVHVEDAARLLEIAVDRTAASCPIVNGGSGEGISVRDILEEVFKVSGMPQQPCFTGQARPGDPPGYQADIAAATAWGWHPQVHWREGVSRYVEWFRRGRK